METLEIRDLSFTYAGEKRPALDGIRLSLREGETAVITGRTGCGKTTLLRLIKRELAPAGEKSGRILFTGRDTDTLSAREAAGSIGFVFQRPEHQIVTDRVGSELAFGLENLGCPEPEMKRRIAETARFFGLEEIFDRRTDELSGGQKQILNLAAVTAMRPRLLLLDEPTARLDPLAADNFLAALMRLNRETGMTVLIAEHRPEEILSGADRLIRMRDGRITADAAPREVCAMEADESDEGALPSSARIWRMCPAGETCPLSVAEGRAWLSRYFRADGKAAPAAEEKRRKTAENSRTALEMRGVTCRFDRKGPDVLREASLTVSEGEILCLLGGNGSGKTTLLRAAAGLMPPVSGEIRIFGKRIRDYRNEALYLHGAAMLPQDAQALFVCDSVRDELKDAGLRPEDTDRLPFALDLPPDRHPYDLSGGEQQLLALAKVLAHRPGLLLLDEPTNGLDAAWRSRIAEILRKLRDSGTAILTATHDTEFAARIADRCALLFRGSVTAEDAPEAFFAAGSFYTTQAARITRGTADGCVTVGEAAEWCRKHRIPEEGSRAGR